MKKYIFIFVAIAILWLVIYTWVILGFYTTVKYNFEMSIDDSNTLDRIYFLLGSTSLLSLFWYIISIIMIAFIYYKKK